jgi:hypothetical protein
MTALCVAFWATFSLVLVDHVSKQCLLYAVGCANQQRRIQGYIVIPISTSLVEALMSREFRSICHLLHKLTISPFLNPQGKHAEAVF